MRESFFFFSLSCESLSLYIPENGPSPPTADLNRKGLVASELQTRSKTQTDSEMGEGRLEGGWESRRSRFREHQVLRRWSGVHGETGDTAISCCNGVRS